MTSTVLDVTVLLLCVSASVVALGDAGNGAGVQGPTADEVADRLVTETVTVRYPAPEGANGTRGVHATRAELLALLVADGGVTDSGADTDGSYNGEDESSFESRARNAVAAGIDDRTRIDVTIPTNANREETSTEPTSHRPAANQRGGRQTVGRIATSGDPNAPRSSPNNGLHVDLDASQNETGRSTAPRDGRTIAVGPEPPRNADVATAVVTHPEPSESAADGPVRIVVRRW
ncbi:MAG: hypothetical protein R6U01_10720 [Halorubrum sp.]|uniref:DUF7284 family protein n=1 Tax=Halorubrum sp. TaxID=1879286 RepID=UPI003970478A